MNAIRLLTLGAIVCLFNAGVRADDKKEEKKDAKKGDYAKLIVGKWEVTKAEGGLPEGTTVEFTKDGKLILTIKAGDQDMKLEGKYKLDGDKFEIEFKMGDQEGKDTITIKKLDENTMSTSNPAGNTVEMKRKK